MGHSFHFIWIYFVLRSMLINFDSSTVMVIISYRSEGFLHE